MAVKVDVDNLPEGQESAANPETKYIPAGNRVARLVSYVELGKHFQTFNGKPAIFEKGKNAGKEKPPVLHIGLTFEFPEEEYTGDYPLTIETTSRMRSGDFMNSLTVPESLANGTMSKEYAMRTRFMKYLTAMQAATGENFSSLAEFAEVQAGVMINVTNRKGKGDNADKVYANMKPEGIVAPRFEHPRTREVEEIEVPAAIGEYCKVYDWDNPTPEAWKALKPWQQKIIQDAVDYIGSPTYNMITADPGLAQTAAESVKDESVKTPEEAHRQPQNEDIPV